MELQNEMLEMKMIIFITPLYVACFLEIYSYAMLNKP